MADEYQTPCIKPIKPLCEPEDVQNFWFDSPLRFGLYAYLVNKLPVKVSLFQTSESMQEGATPEPLELIQSKKEESIRLTDHNELPVKHGVIIYNARTKTTFPVELEAKHEITVLIRSFAPNRSNLDKHDIVDLNIISTVIKRLLYAFTVSDVWHFEGVTANIFKNLKLTEINSAYSDSNGAEVRAQRESNDITVTFTVDEELEDLEFGE